MLPFHGFEGGFFWSPSVQDLLDRPKEGMSLAIVAMKCPWPGRAAVLTTEINVDSDVDAVKMERDDIYLKSDFLRLAGGLAGLGRHIEPADFDFSDQEADHIVDEPPHMGSPHLKLRIGRFTSTPCGLIVSKDVAQANAHACLRILNNSLD